VSRLILNNTKNSTNNGMKSFWLHKKKMHKHLESLKIGTLSKSKATDSFLRKNCL